jgi:hypothetical protein
VTRSKHWQCEFLYPLILMNMWKVSSSRLLAISFLVAGLFNVLPIRFGHGQEAPLSTCQSSLSAADLIEQDPSLHEMRYDVGPVGKNGISDPQSFLAYVEPDVNSFYRNSEPREENDNSPRTLTTPLHNGLVGKFINMSNRHVTLHW